MKSRLAGVRPARQPFMHKGSRTQRQNKRMERRKKVITWILAEKEANPRQTREKRKSHRIRTCCCNVAQCTHNELQSKCVLCERACISKTLVSFSRHFGRLSCILKFIFLLCVLSQCFVYFGWKNVESICLARLQINLRWQSVSVYARLAQSLCNSTAISLPFHCFVICCFILWMVSHSIILLHGYCAHCHYYLIKYRWKMVVLVFWKLRLVRCINRLFHR